MTDMQTTEQNIPPAPRPGQRWRSSIPKQDMTIRFILSVTGDFVAYRNCSGSGQPYGDRDQLHKITISEWDEWVLDVRAESITVDMVPFPYIDMPAGDWAATSRAGCALQPIKSPWSGPRVECRRYFGGNHSPFPRGCIP